MPTQKDEILTLLTTLKPTAEQLADWLMTDTATAQTRISELRREGYTIETERAPGGNTRSYVLRGRRDGDG